MTSISEIIDKALGVEEGVDGMPDAARKLIGWFKTMKERSKGTFDFETEKDNKTGSVHIALTFKKGPTEESGKVDIAANGSMVLDGEHYSGHGVNGPYGRGWHCNPEKEVIAEVIEDILGRIKKCKQANVPADPGPVMVQEVAQVPVIRRGQLTGPRS